MVYKVENPDFDHKIRPSSIQQDSQPLWYKNEVSKGRHKTKDALPQQFWIEKMRFWSELVLWKVPFCSMERQQLWNANCVIWCLPLSRKKFIGASRRSGRWLVVRIWLCEKLDNQLKRLCLDSDVSLKRKDANLRVNKHFPVSHRSHTRCSLRKLTIFSCYINRV